MGDIAPAQCRAARALLGWSQRELARTSGVSRRTIIYFEADLRPLVPRIRRCLADTLDAAGIVFAPDGSVTARRGGEPVSPRAVAGNIESGHATATGDLMEKARRFHMRAEEYRAVSEAMRTPSARQSYALLAASYERLAKHYETRAAGSPRNVQAEQEKETG